MSGLSARLALVVGSLAAGGVGWFSAQKFGDDPTTATALAAADFFDCSITTTGDATSVGQVHAGDVVWLIGTTDNRWAVIRNPDKPDRPAWIPLSQIATDAALGALPELTCAAATVTAATVTATTLDNQAATNTTIGLTVPSTVVLATSTTETSTTTSTTTTIASDVTPPTVTVTPNRDHLYVLTNRPPCSTESTLEVTIVVADRTLPLSIRSIIATWNSPAGPQTASLQPLAGNRFSLQITSNGPAGGETPLTLTATAADGAGNAGTGQAVVSLRDPSSFGCA